MPTTKIAAPESSSYKDGEDNVSTTSSGPIELDPQVLQHAESILSTTPSNNWKMRREMLTAVSSMFQLSYGVPEAEGIMHQLEPLYKCFATQLSDRHSTIQIQTCDCLVAIANSIGVPGHSKLVPLCWPHLSPLIYKSASEMVVKSAKRVLEKWIEKSRFGPEKLEGLEDTNLEVLGWMIKYNWSKDAANDSKTWVEGQLNSWMQSRIKKAKLLISAETAKSVIEIVETLLRWWPQSAVLSHLQTDDDDDDDASTMTKDDVTSILSEKSAIESVKWLLKHWHKESRMEQYVNWAASKEKYAATSSDGSLTRRKLDMASPTVKAYLPVFGAASTPTMPSKQKSASKIPKFAPASAKSKLAAAKYIEMERQSKLRKPSALKSSFSAGDTKKVEAVSCDEEPQAEVFDVPVTPPRRIYKGGRPVPGSNTVRKVAKRISKIKLNDSLLDQMSSSTNESTSVTKTSSSVSIIKPPRKSSWSCFTWMLLLVFTITIVAALSEMVHPWMYQQQRLREFPSTALEFLRNSDFDTILSSISSSATMYWALLEKFMKEAGTIKDGMVEQEVESMWTNFYEEDRLQEDLLAGETTPLDEISTTEAVRDAEVAVQKELQSEKKVMQDTYSEAIEKIKLQLQQEQAEREEQEKLRLQLEFEEEVTRQREELLIAKQKLEALKAEHPKDLQDDENDESTLNIDSSNYIPFMVLGAVLGIYLLIQKYLVPAPPPARFWDHEANFTSSNSNNDGLSATPKRSYQIDTPDGAYVSPGASYSESGTTPRRSSRLRRSSSKKSMNATTSAY